jgi:hypothetical protein
VDHYCKDWKCIICNPPPFTDKDYGLPIYDPYNKTWTFPYAKAPDIIVKKMVKKEVIKEIPRKKKLMLHVGV